MIASIRSFFLRLLSRIRRRPPAREQTESQRATTEMFRALYSDKKVADMVARRSPLLSLVDRQRQASEPATFVVTTSTPGAESTNGSIHPFVFNKRNGDAN